MLIAGNPRIYFLFVTFEILALELTVVHLLEKVDLKFCLGLTDVLKHDRPDLDDDPASQRFTASLKKAMY